MTSPKKTPNRLIHEKSPYLLQHAYNPVDWYPWGDEAFQKAKQENKPVFLSIGYSTCHWCHVMEHESFEDQEVASLMNEAFVNIKVDREERPDIDSVYMTVCQMTTGSGGWPMTILMTPDKQPFFAGTYFPKLSRWGRPGMLDLVPRIQEIWKLKPEEVKQSASQIVSALIQSNTIAAGEPLGKAALDLAYEQLRKRFDDEYGGFGHAPKFPTPHNLLFLLRYWKRTGKKDALQIVEQTLQGMRKGGIYDHIGFGFHRYSTDQKWLVPHFEKMLYDQALLLMAYTEAYQATGKKQYAETAHEIIAYVLRDMTSPEGGFYSAEDADSEGVEGKFYVWSMKELREVLNETDADFLARVFNLEADGNFFDEASQSQTHENIFHLKRSWDELAAEFKTTADSLQNRWNQIRGALFEYREKRVHPYKDDKILTDWNGLMITALSRAAQVFDNDDYEKAAVKAADFILEKMMKPDSSLIHRYREGEAGLPSHLDDYSFVVSGLLDLYETVFKPQYLQRAKELTEYAIAHFWDESSGGFYFTSDTNENLLVRQKEIYDGAIPSGNSVSLLNLLKLSRMTGSSEYENKAAQIEKAFSNQVGSVPMAHTQLMIALDFAEGQSVEIVVAAQNKDDARALLREIRSGYVPNKVVLLNSNVPGMGIAGLAPYAVSQVPVDGKPTVYVCRNFVCSRPTTDPAEVSALINNG